MSMWKRTVTNTEKRLIPVIAVVVFVGAIVWIGSWLWPASGIPADIQADKERKDQIEANERSPKVALERLTAKNIAEKQRQDRVKELRDWRAGGKMPADMRERKERVVQGYLRLMKAGLMEGNDSNEMHSLQMELKADDLKK